MSISVNRLSDLEQFGIIPLTGEACTIGARILCDLTARGKRIFCDCYGLPADCKLAENWNSSGVCSIMLPYRDWSTLAVFCCFDSGCDKVILWEHGAVQGFRPNDGNYFEKTVQLARDHATDKDRWECMPKIERTFRRANVPSEGTRAVHQMSGRAAPMVEMVCRRCGTDEIAPKGWTEIEGGLSDPDIVLPADISSLSLESAGLELWQQTPGAPRGTGKGSKP